MPQLMELLEDETVKALYPAAEEGFIRIAMLREQQGYTGPDEGIRYTHPGARHVAYEEAVDLAESTLRWVHQAYWVKATPHDGLPIPYTHTLRYGPPMNKIIGHVLQGATHTQIKRSAGVVAVALRRNQLMERMTPGKAGQNSPWMLRAWPEGFIIDPSNRSRKEWTARSEHDYQSQIKRNPAGAVEVTHNVRAIPVPDPFTPSTAKVYVAALRNAYDDIAAKLDKTLVRNSELEAELSEARVELEDLRKTSFVEWAELGKELRDT